MKFLIVLHLLLLVSCARLNVERLDFTKSITKQVIIVDIDHTIADVSVSEFLFKNYKEIPKLPFSSDVLNALKGKYDIIYLTARHEMFKEHTMNWLKYNNFPEGPVLFWNLVDFPFFDSEYKYNRLTSLKEKGINIAFAVGDKDSDIEAYSKHKLKSFIIRDIYNSADYPAVTFVKSWTEIKGQISGD
ncbi:MAG: hypothetical protein K9K67_12145 [Bacteriovoracaceae bacterium]|nr:hypothetical protein [Bacteriovoracaceae bacterium]